MGRNLEVYENRNIKPERVNISISFQYTSKNQEITNQIKNDSIYNSNKKIEIPINKFDKTCTWPLH